MHMSMVEKALCWIQDGKQYLHRFVQGSLQGRSGSARATLLLRWQGAESGEGWLSNRISVLRRAMSQG